MKKVQQAPDLSMQSRSCCLDLAAEFVPRCLFSQWVAGGRLILQLCPQPCAHLHSVAQDAFHLAHVLKYFSLRTTIVNPCRPGQSAGRPQCTVTSQFAMVRDIKWHCGDYSACTLAGSDALWKGVCFDAKDPRLVTRDSESAALVLAAGRWWNQDLRILNQHTISSNRERDCGTENR